MIQDLPFGEKTLKLSSNAQIKVPNVARSLIPEQTVLRYLGYCRDVGVHYAKFSVYVPLPRGDPCRAWAMFQQLELKLLTNWKR